MKVSAYTSRIMAGETHRRPAVALDGEDCTSDVNERVDIFCAREVMARNRKIILPVG